VIDNTAYNADTVPNAVGTVLMVAGVLLYKEGYKPDQVMELLAKVTDVSMAIFEKRAQVTDSGIIFNKGENVVPFNGT